jgi:fimbrial chaperone protein
MRRIALLAQALTAALLALAGPAAAGSLEIGPTSVQMIGPERTSTIRIKNIADADTTVQVRTVDWTQQSGQDVYTPSTTLLASPPLIKLKPGESQVIRLVIERTPAQPQEKAYRLILDEIPNPGEVNGAAVHQSLRALVPIFITPSTSARPRLTWSATRSGDGVVLTAANNGATRERLVGLTVNGNGAQIGPPLDGYILSNASHSWTVAVPASVTSLTASGEGGYGTVQANVPIGP